MLSYLHRIQGLFQGHWCHPARASMLLCAEPYRINVAANKSSCYTCESSEPCRWFVASLSAYRTVGAESDSAVRKRSPAAEQDAACPARPCAGAPALRSSSHCRRMGQGPVLWKYRSSVSGVEQASYSNKSSRISLAVGVVDFKLQSMRVQSLRPYALAVPPFVRSKSDGCLRLPTKTNQTLSR